MPGLGQVQVDFGAPVKLVAWSFAVETTLLLAEGVAGLVFPNA